MENFYKNLVKSILYGVIIIVASLYLFSIIFNGEDAGIFIIGIAITSTIIFCTYTIIDTIKEHCRK